MLVKAIYFLIWNLLFTASTSLAYRDNSKFLGNDLSDDGRTFGKRRRPANQGSTPCNFGGGYGKPKSDGSGRTFFDLQYFNVEHNYNLNINCGGNGGSYPVHPAPVTETHPTEEGHFGGHKPIGGLGGGGGGHKPFRPGKPGGGGGHFGGQGNGGGGGGWFGSLFGGNNNKPQKPFKPNDSEGSEGLGSEGSTSAFAGIFPSPQQFATGLSEGLQSFIGTIPAIGQSFQSILPSFSDFQWPQLPQFNPGGAGSILSNPFNRPPAVAAPVATTPSVVTPSPLTTTTDPDDIIYSDEIKPVNEDYDPITDPYSNKLRPGNLPPGQYLVISNPHLGSYTQSLSAFNPTNLHNKWHEGIAGALDELATYF